jgi:hypothetical protein
MVVLIGLYSVLYFDVQFLLKTFVIRQVATKGYLHQKIVVLMDTCIKNNKKVSKWYWVGAQTQYIIYGFNPRSIINVR